jgi:hypothetical protein
MEENGEVIKAFSVSTMDHECFQVISGGDLVINVVMQQSMESVVCLV